MLEFAMKLAKIHFLFDDMSAHSVAATSSRGCFSNKCSAALKVLKCSGPAVSLKGTSGPTRFVVLKDEANHTVDDFQNIANIICSGFQIATKSAGIATLTYYANQFSTWANK
ncbi:hypothetical protein BY996DRAFT_6419717 [Phakopsora pachyrhizi]|nr:hypothetical protein BY996DRAFT_6419717 [Phakopsora pachyrhizi]